MPLDKQQAEILEGLHRALQADVPAEGKTPQALRDFHVYKVWRMEPFGWTERTGSNGVGPASQKHQLDGGRRVQDDQRESRSSRSTRVGEILPV